MGVACGAVRLNLQHHKAVWTRHFPQHIEPYVASLLAASIP